MLVCFLLFDVKHESLAQCLSYNSSAAYELRQRGGRSNHYGAGCGTSDAVAETDYKKLDKPQRCAPAIPSIYEELNISQTCGECNIYDSGSQNDIDADGPDYEHPDASQKSLSNILATNDESVIDD